MSALSCFFHTFPTWPLLRDPLSLESSFCPNMVLYPHTGGCYLLISMAGHCYLLPLEEKNLDYCLPLYPNP